MNDPRLKQLKIKTGVLKRTFKEKLMYGKEVEREQMRLAKMKGENKDHYDIRKQEEVINETMMMIPDSEARVLTAYKDLKALLQETESELTETEEFAQAKTCLEEVTSFF